MIYFDDVNPRFIFSSEFENFYYFLWQEFFRITNRYNAF